jgi:ribosomal protein S18 acetylase RimI-like enzyme
MSTLTKSITETTRATNLRPFDPRRDLTQVADLVELCFTDTLDQEGHSYLRQMRMAAAKPGYLRWVSMMNERTPVPLSGLVWEEDGRVVGNLTLIPYVGLKYSFYLIANVAVHPSYRRRGIARNLTSAAVAYARRRRAQAVWLHVRAENNAAGDLYRSLGFVERARRTTWHSKPVSTVNRMLVQQTLEQQTQPSVEPGVRITPRRSSDWDIQRSWLKKLYPALLSWHLAIREPAIQPGVVSYIYRAFNNMDVRSWSARRGKRLAGVLTWQGSMGYADHLWLAIEPDGDESAVAPLLSHALRCCSSRRALSLDFPGEKSVEAIRSAGFEEHQTLVWMELEFG